MGDKRRFDVFASFIERHVQKDARIADVAAGKGYLSFALRERGFKHISTFEPRPRRGGQVIRLNMHVREFKADMAKDFDVVVGMHPDGATDEILEGAARHGCEGIVVPCCTRPSAWTYWGQKQRLSEWLLHLRTRGTERGLEIRETTLKMSGANVVLWGRKR